MGLKKKTLETLNSSSFSYTDDSNNFKQRVVTDKTSHFISLTEDNNLIELDINSDVLIRANIYKKNVINPINDMNLSWVVPHTLDEINQPIWSNSNRDDGLERRKSILLNKEYLVDSFQKNGLERSANISTFMKQLYPTVIPKGSFLSEANYGIRTLYLEEVHEKISALNPKYTMAHLNTIKSAVLAEVPVDYMSETLVDINKTLEKFYFKTRAYKLNKGQKRKVQRLIQNLGDYAHIYLFGYTDSTASRIFNMALSLKRSKSIKSEMVRLGIPPSNISIASTGEENQLIKTLDENSEASNRRVEIKILYRVPQYKYLEYKFDAPLSEDTELEITVFNNDKKDKQLDVYVDNKHYKTLEYGINADLENRSFSRGLTAYASYTDRRAKEIVATLHNTCKKPLLLGTGTIHILLPKGSKSIKFTRSKQMAKFKISLRMRKGSIYKDTPHMLAHEYGQTFHKFFDSLHKPLLEGKSFNSWYEHTHPLRLWILAQIRQAYNNIENQDIAGKESLEYAQTLIHNDIFTARNIAKHALLLNPDKRIQESAYRLLLSLSSNDTEKLIWHSAYFYRTSSALVLKEIATLLHKKGQLGLSLNILLLLKRDYDTIFKICELSLLQNKIQLYEYLCEEKNSYLTGITENQFLEKKIRLISREEKTENLSAKHIHIEMNGGVKTVYSEQRHLEFKMHAASVVHPLQVKVEGPIRIEFDIRFSSPVKHFAWMKIEHNEKIYHYPLTQYKPSTSLTIKPEDRNISVSNNLSLILGKGSHILTMHSYENPILISMKSHFIKESDVLPLHKQILQTSDYNATSWRDVPFQETIPYTSSLLWNYMYETLDHRYNSQAHAVMSFENISNPYIKSILAPMLAYSSFVPYKTPQATLGFQDILVPSWNPNSVMQKNRLFLLAGINSYDVVLHGSDIKVIHFSGNQRFTLEGKQFSPKYFISNTLYIGITLDNEQEEVIELNTLKKNWVKHFDLPVGEHSIKVRLIDPLSTHYFAFNMYENMKKISRETTKRYYATSHKDPIIIYAKGPKLLRIEAYNPSGIQNILYKYLSEDREYRYEVLPIYPHSESLVHVSRLEHDLLKNTSKLLDVPSNMPFLLSAKKRTFSLGVHDHNTSRLIPIEDHESTFTTEVRFFNQRLGSEDNEDFKTENVMQVGAYFRTQFLEDNYLRVHYFSKLYDNKLYGFKHKLYLNVPLIDNASSTFEVNGYMQNNNLYWFKNFEFKADIVIEKILDPKWKHRYGGGVFRYFLDSDNTNHDSLDPWVYSQYKRDHQYGIYGKYDLSYQPYDDLRFTLKTKLQSNEQLAIVDNFKSQLNVYHHVHPFDIRLFYNKWYYLEDRHRREGVNIDNIGTRVRFEKFIGTDRLQFDVGLKYELQNDDLEFGLGITWHYSNNRRFYNFMPDEKIFNSLRLRLNYEER
ncbi:MAG: OmpA family protein [Sulfurovum sp.]|nr:OmpA family protein [Sulfurovum sp.]